MSSWGISCDEVGITKGSSLTDAVLVLEGIRHSTDSTGLQICLLRNPAVGFQGSSFPQTEEIDLGLFLNGDITDRIVCFFSGINNPESSIWKVFRQPFVMPQADQSRTKFSSATLELMDILGTEKTFGLGFRMDGIGTVEIERVSLQLSILPHQDYGKPLYKTYSLIQEDFESGGLSGWSIVDQGILYAPSVWTLTNGQLRQNNNTCQQNLQASAVDMRGTCAVCQASRGLGDFQMAVDLCSIDDDAIGILFRYCDSDNYYRFSWDQQRKARRLVKCRNGRFTVLAEDSVVYEIGKTYRAAIVARGPQFAVAIDGVPIFRVSDSDFTEGSIGLYCCADQGAVFDNVRIEGTRSWTRRLMAPIGKIEGNSDESIRVPIHPPISIPLVHYWTDSTPDGPSAENEELIWHPDSSKVGLHLIRVFGEVDDRFDSQTVEIQVHRVNHPPQITPPGFKTVREGDTLDVIPIVSDPDGDPITLRLENQPANIRLENGRLSWTPDFSQAGIYFIRIIASDGSLESHTTVLIRVQNMNRPPVIGQIPTVKTLMIGRYLNIPIPTSDLDGDTVVLSSPNLPVGATLTDDTLTWMPGTIQSGLYDIEIVASDGIDKQSKRIEIRVF